VPVFQNPSRREGVRERGEDVQSTAMNTVIWTYWWWKKRSQARVHSAPLYLSATRMIAVRWLSTSTYADASQAHLWARRVLVMHQAQLPSSEKGGSRVCARHWTRCACNLLDDMNEAIHVVRGRAIRAEVMRGTEHSEVRVHSPLDLDQRLNR
jgi:hypothetical protein